MTDGERRDNERGNEKIDDGDLTELLSETKILLPGTEIFLAVLTTLPFSERFERLSPTETKIYVCTFLATLLAFIAMVAPAAYHRIARPLRDKERFKTFASLFLVMGLVPLSLSIVLSTYLVCSMIMGNLYALLTAGGVGAVLGVLWWLIPMLRAHDKVDPNSSQSKPR